MSQDPNHDLSKPFSVEKITKVVESLLKRDRFDNARIVSDSEETSSDSDADGTDSDSDSSDDDDDCFCC